MKNAGLNRSYRLVWSEVHQAFIAVAELVRSCGKGASKAAVVLACASAVQAGGLPTGGQVVAGSGAIAQAGQTMTVTQHSEKMATDWQSFSIGKAQSVNFIQPSASSVALNRVLGSDVSVIQGALNANGQVFVVNPNGVLFTPSAQVNVGALAASTLQLSTGDFLAGNYRFSGPSTAGVSNEGSIQVTAGGSVALIAARIENTGRITAPQGNVLLGAGSKVRLDLGGAVKLEVEKGALDTLITQGGAIRADGGLVYLTAKAAGDLASSVINHTGITEARSLHTGDKGQIMLMGDMAHGTVHVAGTLDASRGFVETSAQQVQVADGAQVKAGHWLIDPVDFTIRADSSTQTTSGIGASTLASALGAGDVSIQTDSGTGGNGDIFVNSAVTWNTDKKLTLSAHRNIAINADITAQHADGKVQLEYGQGATEAGNTANYSFGGGRINLGAGDNFFTKLGSDGAVTPWKVITALGTATDKDAPDMFTLQGLGHNSNMFGKFVLGADINASAASSWNSGQGLEPIQFRGSFDGLGHTITGLTIDRPTESFVALFRFIGETGTVRNVGIVNADVTGQSRVGALVGQNSGNVSHSYATGTVSGEQYVGGISGTLTIGGTVNHSYATTNVQGITDVGGLVGNANISTTTISNSYAAGRVEGEVSAGGLVGSLTAGTVSNSYATGIVTSTSGIPGGLIGRFEGGTVSNSFWNTDTTAQGFGITGGTPINVMGKTTADLQTLSTFAEAGWDIDDVGGTGKVWRIYQGDTAPLLRSFLQPMNVTAVASLANPTHVYDGSTHNGGNGYTVPGGDPSKIFYGGSSQGAKNVGSYTLGIFSTQSGYDLSGNRFAASGLTIDTKPLTVTGMTASDKTYNGNTVAALVGGTLVGLAGSETLNFSGHTGSFANKDAGTNKPVTVSGVTLSNGSNGGLASNYSVSDPTGLNATITPKPLAVTGMNASDKVYNGTSEASLTAGTLSGFVGSETVSFSGQTGSFANANAGSNKPVTVSGVTLANGSNGGLASNYSVTNPTGLSADITPKPLTVTGMNASDKVYNGTSEATLTGGTLSGFVGSETVSFSGQTGSFANPNAGSSKPVTVSGITLANGSNGGLAANYSVTSPTDVSASITQKPLAITADNASKTYGDADPTLTYAVTSGSLVAGDSLAGVLTRAPGENVGSYTIDASALANGNYLITATDGALTIGQRPITVTTDNQTKVYGNADPALTYAVTGGSLVAGDGLAGVLARAPGENVGSYTINANALSNGNYLITAIEGALTISQRPITVTADNQTKVYGNADPTLTYTVSSGSLVAGDSLNAALTRSPGENVGSYTIDANALANGNYLITAVNGALTIGQRPITVMANGQTKVYGNADPTLTYAVTGGSLVAGDSLNGVLTRDPGESVGSYTIHANALANGNYLITATDGALSIRQRPITVTADNQAKVYGNSDPALTYAVTSGSLVAGDSLAGVLTRAPGENVGNYTIRANALANGNYLITATDGALSISQRPITVTADNQTKVYGNADPALTYAVTEGNLVTGDRLAGVLTRAPGENAGSYSIDAQALANGNYLITAVNGALSISQRPITVTADNQTKVYGNADPALTYAVTSGSLVAGDRLNEALTRDLGENAGSYTIRANALANGNYLITAIDGALSISQRPVTVTADSQTKVYGDADPALTYAVTQGSLVAGDRFQGTLTRSSGENAGSYTIDASALANGNYLITAVDGALRISPRPITVTANGQIKIHGNADPALTYAITGGNLVAGDQLDGALSRDAGENYGLYAIHQGTVSEASNPNYRIAYVGADLTIGADTQTAIGLAAQAASDIARTQGLPIDTASRTPSLPTDSSDAATRARDPNRLAPSGFVNVFVVQGGINMGTNHAYSTQP
ncbi:MBG domain-containing protein [Acidovorax sp. CCYZU-2555]|uniref:MBG domain-containing protein n=1 Tax=Acidovorax sp. CCYZU-2555 TaxID=2835042 RepID=UPI001BCB6F5E|nr:MBG domain-containing protein [Acidovorax sp. CCYZU-2555]MBS7778532.1 filamentous hemagglutinin N-terminal domain-containing protein [Acidovorax sp. CCYZU-2555]